MSKRPTAATTLAAIAIVGIGGIGAHHAFAQSSPVRASPKTEVGRLACNVSGGVGFIITSQRALNCRFTDNRGRTEQYVGTIRKFGLDIGATTGGVLVWAVAASTSRLGRGALQGEYAGASGEATVGAGVGANVLVGGSNRAVSLQPLSVQGQTGLNLALGVADMRLELAR
ncbi:MULTISPECIES: DUF992 domain-containing protein [Chelatococcus]|uniref:DUF992 domain-containing protein n=1 Tax=Chelatococcus caeni TaxID=1348468 RepID=A0A840C3E5_9HYPH|nr:MULTISPECIES: DUF992 domain-containing protein [unclassified Chelatococcus]MBB4018019.1 hypothetical protein [Chelatococcus caeni]